MRKRPKVGQSLIESPTVLFVCMPATGHVQRTIPVIHEFIKRQYNVLVYAHLKHRQLIENAGGKFVDLFTMCPVDVADSESIPIPIRFVSYAAYYYEVIKEMIADIDPALIIYDSFSVVAQLVAIDLNIPYINICSGHNRSPDILRQDFANRPGKIISRSCEAAIECFNQENTHVTLEPYYIASMRSPYLNLYCEPSQFLRIDERKSFEPVVFFGSINPARNNRADQTNTYFSRQSRHKIYVSFGTASWRYYRQEALKSIAALAHYFMDKPDAEIIFSLGGTKLKTHEYNELQFADHISFKDYVDQWSILKEANLFITHHGLNSTHEAIFHEVPMLSHPFFYDQPELAKRCQEFGLAIPLIKNISDALSQDAINKAFNSYHLRSDEIKSKLREARNWELDTVGNRETIIELIEGKLDKAKSTE